MNIILTVILSAFSNFEILPGEYNITSFTYSKEKDERGFWTNFSLKKQCNIKIKINQVSKEIIITPLNEKRTNLKIVKFHEIDTGLPDGRNIKDYDCIEVESKRAVNATVIVDRMKNEKYISITNHNSQVNYYFE